jgi:hypothetical protein
MTTHTVPFYYTTAQTLTAKIFTAADALEDEASSVTEATNRKQRYVATFEDVAAGDYMMVYYIAGTPVGYELVRFTGVNAEVAVLLEERLAVLDTATQTQIADILTDTGTTIPAQISALSGSTVQVASPNVSGNLVLTQGDDYDGTANPRASWTVTTDYTDGWSVALTIRDADDAVVYTTAGTVVSSTVVAVTIAAPTGLTMTGCPGQWQGKFDVQLTHTATGKKKTIALGVCYINEDQTR